MTNYKEILRLHCRIRPVLYGILSGDNEASNLARAQHHLSEFYNALGVKRQVDAAWPRTSTGGAQ